MGSLIYQLPEDVNEIRRVIDIIPSGWSQLDAGLWLPRKFYEEEKAIFKQTRLDYNGKTGERDVFSSDDLAFEDEYSEREKKPVRKSNILDSTRVSVLYSSISFSNIGTNPNKISIKTAKTLLESYIKLWYKGEIVAFRVEKNRTIYQPSERFGIYHSRDESSGIILLEWIDVFNGKRENLEGIVEELRGLGIKEKGLELV